MNPTDSMTAVPAPIAALRRFSRRTAVREQCDLCSAELAPEHQHLLDPQTRMLMCACDACAVLFSAKEAAKYRRVPRQLERWTDFRLDDSQWAGLGIPISLAFFVRSTPAAQVIAVYPSPGGPTEAAIPPDGWDGLLKLNPRLAELESDVEALLVNRVNGSRDYYRAPIDECYKLVGLIRTRWRGLSGGREVWEEIRGHFAVLKARSS